MTTATKRPVPASVTIFISSIDDTTPYSAITPLGVTKSYATEAELLKALVFVFGTPKTGRSFFIADRRLV